MKRSEQIRRLETARLVSKGVGLVSVCTAFLMMGGMDGGRWWLALLIMVVSMGLAAVSSLVTDECEHRIRKLTRYGFMRR